MLADLDHYLRGQGQSLGFAVPRLYQLAHDPTTYAADFHDLTQSVKDLRLSDSRYAHCDVYIPDPTKPTQVATAAFINALPMGPGWDEVSGLGSPDLTNIARDWTAPIGIYFSPSTVAPGDTVQAVVEPGYLPPNTPVTILIDGHVFAHNGTDANGQLMLASPVPKTFPPGTYTIQVVAAMPYGKQVAGGLLTVQAPATTPTATNTPTKTPPSTTTPSPTPTSTATETPSPTPTGTPTGSSGSITEVSFGGDVTNPQITITGTNLGVLPTPVTPGCGIANNGSDYTSASVLNALYISDYSAHPQSWDGGEPTSCIGLVNVSFSPTQVSYSFGAGYADYPSYYRLAQGDPFTLGVNGALCSGTVDYTRVVVCTMPVN